MQQQQFEFNRRAIRPVQCLSDGWAMLTENGQYGSFLGVFIIAGLLILVSACVPLMPLLPPMICGLYLCQFAIMNRQPVNSSTLFKGFDFFGQSFLASLVVTLPTLVLSIVMQIGVGGAGAILEGLEKNNNSNPENIVPVLTVFGFIIGFYLFIIGVMFVLGILTAFVYPLIVDRHLNAWSAIKLSFRAVMGNFLGVVGLLFLGQLILAASVFFFYIGALFVAPVIFAAWAIAYRRVFPLYVSQPSTQIGGFAQQYAWTPPVSRSKAGWVLTFGALAVFGLIGSGIAALGYFSYQAVTTAIVKAEEERRRTEILMPHRPTSTPNLQQTPKTDHPPSVKSISGGVLNGKAVELPQPEYSPLAKSVRASGSVNVQVTVNENGNVISANAVSGHPLLRATAVSAAIKAKFSPTLLAGEAVKVTGIIVYKFDAQS